jgi:hypothetical protein
VTQDLVAQVAAQDQSMVIHPGTGEIAPADDPVAVALLLGQLRDHAKSVQDARKLAEQILAEHARVAGTKTLRLDGCTVTVRDGDKIGWDIEVLEQLLDAGLPDARWNELVKQEVTVKVDARVAKQIAAANETYAAIVEKAQTREPGNLYVSVSS